LEGPKRVDLSLPEFDEQFPANMLAVKMAETSLTILGLRVPYYSGESQDRLRPSWTGWKQLPA
jgi:hypothetical protein